MLMTKLQDKSEVPRLIPSFLGFEELELPTTANPDLSSGLKKRMTENPENPNGCTSVSNKKDVAAVGKCGVVVSFHSETKPLCPAVAEIKFLIDRVSSSEEEKSCHTAVFELEVNDDGRFPSASKGQEGDDSDIALWDGGSGAFSSQVVNLLVLFFVVSLSMQPLYVADA